MTRHATHNGRSYRIIYAGGLWAPDIIGEIMNQYPETRTETNDLAATLRFLRKARQMTLREVAEDTGLSVSFISDIERGRTRPSLATLQKLAGAYNAPILLEIRP